MLHSPRADRRLHDLARAQPGRQCLNLFDQAFSPEDDSGRVFTRRGPTDCASVPRNRRRDALSQSRDHETRALSSLSARPPPRSVQALAVHRDYESKLSLVDVSCLLRIADKIPVLPVATRKVEQTYSISSI